MKYAKPSILGLTLIELLAVIAVCAVMATLCLGTMQYFRAKGQQVKELTIGRASFISYANAAAERNGVYLAGFGLDEPRQVVVDGSGKNVGALIGNRYPYRLGPYIDFAMHRLVTPEVNKMAATQSDPAYVYSVFPTFGINYWMFGGDKSTGTLRYAKECIDRVSQSDRSIIAFVTAASGTGADKANGYFRVTPPTLSIPNWLTSEWSEKKDPSAFGFVDARHDGRAICIFSDGSSRLLRIAELQDMRLWSRRAAELDDPRHVPTL